jgi:glycerophosphoryl diester phosphodiesterase
MLIIGHRGARGLEDENTLESFAKALKLGVDGIEFDVWTSKDGVPVVIHDSSLARTTTSSGQVFDMTLDQIKTVRTRSGYKIPTVEEALKMLKGTPVMLEIKDFYLSDGVLKLLDKFDKMDISITSFRHNVLSDLNQRRQGLKLYAATSWHPVETVHFIRQNNLYGLTLNHRSFNPIIYWLASRQKIKMRLYTVNSPFYVKLLKRFKFKVDICTDFPDRFLAK